MGAGGWGPEGEASVLERLTRGQQEAREEAEAEPGAAPSRACVTPVM